MIKDLVSEQQREEVCVSEWGSGAESDDLSCGRKHRGFDGERRERKT